MNVTAGSGPISDKGFSVAKGWAAFFSLSAKVLTALTQSGTTANRPTVFLWVGRPYFDTTLGKPIWYDANGTTGWCDSSGTAV